MQEDLEPEDSPGQMYRSVLFLDVAQPETSETFKIWKSLSESECVGLVKGSMVQLIPSGIDKNGKDKHNIALMDSQTSVAAPSSTTAQTFEWTVDEKKAIAAKVNQHADLLKYCLETSRAKFDGLVETEESYRSLAVTLFLSVSK